MGETSLSVECAALPDRMAARVTLSVQEGRIRDLAVSAQQDRPTLGGTLLPGLVDLQVNGAGGRGVDEATTEALDTVARAVWDGGAVAFLPTLITAPFSALLEQLAAVARWIEEWNGQGARPLGIHLEGPFLDEPGAHDPELFLDPTAERLDEVLRAAGGHLKLCTLACGRAGAAEAVARLRRAGVAVAIGHARSTAGFAECVDAGAGLVTHLFNAMSGMSHREPGVAGLALDQESLLCPMILDGVHVHPAMARNAYRILGPHRTVLVTDAVSAAGMPDGDYHLSGMPVTLRDGVVRDRQGRLAGSALSMARAAQNFLSMLPGVGPWSLAKVAAANPARAIAADGHGRLAPGCRAEFTLLESDGALRALRV